MMKLAMQKFLLMISAMVLMMTSNVIIADQSRDTASQQAPLPIDDIQRFSTAIGQIKQFYVEPVKDNDLFENAIRGMLSGLDPHSTYLDADDFADLHSSTSGEFGGLGIEVDMIDGYVRVISPIDDTPAAKAGVKPGDLIVRIDDKPVKGISLRDAVTLMRGPKGSDIKITVVRQGENDPLELSITRDIIKIHSVKSRILEKDYGYIRITQFQAPTHEKLVKAIKSLQQQTQQQLKGLVLDLRNNPGGLLDSAIDVSDVFLESDQLKNERLIVYTKGRIKGSEFYAKSSSHDLTNGIPIVVLINSGSASGSEIVAGALQDHERAIIMGTTTFGKGSVQTVLPLDDKRGVKITTALYYTPLGRSIQATGIVPDIIVEDMQFKSVNTNKIAYLKEKDLQNHLANGEKNKTTATQHQADEEKPLAMTDYQLHEALNLLKGLNVVKHYGVKQNIISLKE